MTEVFHRTHVVTEVVHRMDADGTSEIPTLPRKEYVVGCGFPKGSADQSLLGGAINNEYFPEVVQFQGDLAPLEAALKA